MTTLLLHDVEIGGRRVDVSVDGATIEAVAPTDGRRPRVDASIIEGNGGALLPGLWDHHVHLLATAAARGSVAVGPGDVGGPDDLDAVLRQADEAAPPGEWVRAVGYHESVAGELDRHRLDRAVADRPVRVQHRSGAAWILNSPACALVGLDAVDAPGIERDDRGRPTGRILGGDDWLRARLTDDHPDLAPVGAEASRFGIVGFTDATPSADPGAWELLARARRSGALPQHVVVTGGPSLAERSVPAGLDRGPVKLYLADHRLPGLDEVVEGIEAARRADRSVAFHAVTRSALVLAIAALRTAGPGGGDRIEHGSVIPPELDAELVDLGVTVVTQPSFVAERGASYLDDVDPDDVPHLYRCASLRAAGIPMAASSDAPHATLDPWAAVAAAVQRRVADGRVLGAGERVSATTALELFLGAPDDPGGPARPIRPGTRADLCLLDRRLDEALRSPSAEHVAATVIEGRVVHRTTAVRTRRV